MISKICIQCDIQFHARQNRAKFCSRSCAATFNNSSNPKRRVAGACAACNTPISTRTKYCSVTCRFGQTDPARIRQHRTKWMQEFRYERKQRAVDAKGGKCEHCGYAKSLRALQFHHLDPSQKDFNLSRFDGKWERVEVELTKCILVCANCHAEIHDELVGL